MKKYTKQQKLEALKFFEQGFGAREISEVLKIPVGTLYRWKSEDPKPQQTGTSGAELLQLGQKVEELEKLVKIWQPKEPRRTKIGFGEQDGDR